MRLALARAVAPATLKGQRPLRRTLAPSPPGLVLPLPLFRSQRVPGPRPPAWDSRRPSPAAPHLSPFGRREHPAAPRAPGPCARSSAARVPVPRSPGALTPAARAACAFSPALRARPRSAPMGRPGGQVLRPGPRQGGAEPGRGLPTASGPGEAAAAPGAARGRVRAAHARRASRARGLRAVAGHPAQETRARPRARSAGPTARPAPPARGAVPAEAALPLWAPSAGKDWGVQERPESP